jgi:hypothetical protein
MFDFLTSHDNFPVGVLLNLASPKRTLMRGITSNYSNLLELRSACQDHEIGVVVPNLKVMEFCLR